LLPPRSRGGEGGVLLEDTLGIGGGLGDDLGRAPERPAVREHDGGHAHLEVDVELEQLSDEATEVAHELSPLIGHRSRIVDDPEDVDDAVRLDDHVALDRVGERRIDELDAGDR